MGRSTDKEMRLSEQRKYRSWTAKRKIEIVLAGLRGDRSVKEVCREHAISETLYYGWREKLLEGGREVLAGKEERLGERELRLKVAELERALGRKTYELEIAGNRSRRRAASDEQLREAGERDGCERGCKPGDPGLQRRVAQHLLHVERADEDEAEEAATEQQPYGVRSCHRAQPEDPQRHQRRLDARLDDQEGDERRRRGGQKRNRASRSPTDLGRPRERVHEQQQPAGDCDRAERVEPATDSLEPALRDDAWSEQERGDPDRHVQEEDVLPADVAGDYLQARRIDSPASPEM